MPAPHTSAPAPHTSTSARLTDSTRDAVRDLFAQAVEENRTPGVTWAIIGGHDDADAVLASGAAGDRELRNGVPAADSTPMAPGTISRIASMTKSFTAASILKLRDEGRLRLDDEVAAHLPEAAGIAPVTADTRPLTVRDLLTMSAGLVTDNPWGDRQEAMTREAFSAMLRAGLGHVHRPGTGFEYSNTGYVMLGRVIDEVSGVGYDQYIRESFLEPLGMTDTAFSREGLDPARIAVGHRLGDREDRTRFEAEPFDSPGTYGAMAGLYSTTADVARWVRFLAEADALDAADRDQTLLATASRREMQQLHRLQLSPALPVGEDGTSPGFDRQRGYGYGLVVERFPDLDEVISHSGGYPGYGSFMIWHRASGIGITALANSKYAPTVKLSMAALRLMLEQQPELFAAPLPQLAPRTREAADAALAWLRGTDEAAADAWFADNMDLDTSREERRRRLAAALAAAGRDASVLEDLSTQNATVMTPAELRWDIDAVDDDHQAARIHLLMDPRAESRIQGLDTFTRETSPR
ncbi:MAG: serine hydrolase domain-containing protein [Brachybacterium sp.]|nr:serine hydrolase domain-containing protein [Brachybacterium sp.]